MTVNRRFLYWGVFLVALGGVLVTADLRALDTPTLTDVLRLWPLAVIAIGLSLVLRRTRLSLPGLLLAAALPGLVLGAAFAVAPRFVGECGARDIRSGTVGTTQGTFDGPASVTLRIACGFLDVKTVPGSRWQLDAGNTAGRMPRVDSSARSLSIDATSDEGRSFLDGGRDALDLTLPTNEIDDLSLVVFAGYAQVDLPDARIGRLAMTVNAAKVQVDASMASVSEVSGVVNVGALTLHLPAASDLVGSLRVGAGSIRICVPPGLGVRVSSTGTAERIMVNGSQEHASEYQSSDYASATHHADLRVSATFGAVEIDPIGGCE